MFDLNKRNEKTPVENEEKDFRIMLRAPTPIRGNPLYAFWRKMTKPVADLAERHNLVIAPPYQPFGPRFGLTVLPDFIHPDDTSRIRQQYIDIYLRERCRDDVEGEEAVRMSDGRLHLPPLHPACFSGVLTRLEEANYVLPNYLNNQTINLYQAGDFIRSHVDNLFVYDETFAVLSLGSPAMLRMTHIQNGEELECLIPDGSVYIMEGPSRYVYFHSVLPVEAQRLSVVLRRNIFRTSATFGPVPAPMQDMMPWKGNVLQSVVMQKQIGATRISLTDEWMEEQRLGQFDTGEMVKRLKPLRDWTLQQQLDEDRERYDELVREDAMMGCDLAWRFDELRQKFREVEQEVTINTESLAQVRPHDRDARRVSEPLREETKTTTTTAAAAEGKSNKV